ncbi:MAG: hypothetical protein CL831_08255 [Crocinitomicaceae bacterium]|nr:hypothetical protein [Crocinitomicaceae bacterium]|tara:strand:- start:60 stop:656 length:597 start_codon:yes stop_codon:yes gene_type:complete
MRYLITIVIAALSLNAFGQGIPQLPYNPDENGDGLIGVPDLQALLSQYGLEFNSAVLSEDGENAVVNIGDMSYPECASSCRNLPGFWSVATLEDLGIVWSTLYSTYHIWLHRSDSSPNPGLLVNSGNNNWSVYEQMYSSAKCFCAAHELPKVEYFKCIGYGSDAIEECVLCAQQKVSEGWYPLSPSTATTQDLWRWAE